MFCLFTPALHGAQPPSCQYQSLINRWFRASQERALPSSLALAGSGVGSMLMSPLLSYLCGITAGERRTYLKESCCLWLCCPLSISRLWSVHRKRDIRNGWEKRKLQAPVQAPGKTVLTSVPYKEGIKRHCILHGCDGNHADSNLQCVRNQPPHPISYRPFNGNCSKGSRHFRNRHWFRLTIGKIVLGSLCDKIGCEERSFTGHDILFLLFAHAVFIHIQITNFIYLYLMFFCIGGSVGTIVTPLIVSTVFGDKDYSRYRSTIRASRHSEHLSEYVFRLCFR